MKTPEQIKAGLKHCMQAEFCNNCPIEEICKGDIMKESFTLIEQLEEQIMGMKIQMQGDCGVCKHKDAKGDPCVACLLAPNRPAWEYEGLPELPARESP